MTFDPPASPGDQQYDPYWRDPIQEAQHGSGGGDVAQEGVSRQPLCSAATPTGCGQWPQLLPLREHALSLWQHTPVTVTSTCILEGDQSVRSILATFISSEWMSSWIHSKLNIIVFVLFIWFWSNKSKACHIYMKMHNQTIVFLLIKC